MYCNLIIHNFMPYCTILLHAIKSNCTYTIMYCHSKYHTNIVIAISLLYKVAESFLKYCYYFILPSYLSIITIMSLFTITTMLLTVLYCISVLTAISILIFMYWYNVIKF